MRTSKGLARGLAIVAALGTAFFVATGCDFLKPKQKPFGEECAQDTDCESTKCSTYGSICTKPCMLDRECGAGLVCRTADDGAGNLCAKPMGQAIGGTCMGPSECQHAHCLKRIGQESGPGICSAYCETSADCPTGFKVCIPISDTGVDKMCLPGDEKTSAANMPKYAPPAKPKPKPDAGVPGIGDARDAGTTTTPTPDAGTTTTPDAGTTTPDAGTTTPDAGTKTDGGVKGRPPIGPLPGTPKK